MKVVECVLVRRVAYHVLVIIAACSCGFTQDANTATVGARIVVTLPDNIPPESIWVRYALYAPEGGGGGTMAGETLKTDAHSQLYISTMYGGAQAQHAKVAIYAPGCQFVTYDLDLSSDSDFKTKFQCEPLPTKIVHGFLSPEQFPNPIDRAEKKLDIQGYLDGRWVCDFFLQMRGGSCLGSVIPLRTLGELDLANKGIFELTIPDFTRDPVFGRFASHGKFGVIELALEEKKFGRGLGTIKADDNLDLGLNVQANYPNPVMFTTVHH